MINYLIIFIVISIILINISIEVDKDYKKWIGIN